MFKMLTKLGMATKLFVSLCFLLLTLFPFSSSSVSTLTGVSSLSVENSNDYLVSPKGTFSAGFYPVGDNSFCFAIWLTEKMQDGSLTVVWMANRDKPVNGKLSKLIIKRSGNLVLIDASQFMVWDTQTSSKSSVELSLHESGNLVLADTKLKKKLWQSFDFPTDTLLANQPLTRHTSLISSRSLSNYSSGYYKLFFDDDNVLRLLFDRLEVASIYWPSPWLTSYDGGRSNNNNTRTAVFGSSGPFLSSDKFEFIPSDYGSRTLRRLTIGIDGNLRMHSLDKKGTERRWVVTWHAFNQPCRIHGLCGPNALCTYVPGEKTTGRQCICLPGYKVKNSKDWAYGCERDFSLSCKDNETVSVDFLKLYHASFFGYDLVYFKNITVPMCEKECLKRCDCVGFQMSFVSENGNWFYDCYTKSQLFNGYRSPGLSTYIKLPKNLVTNKIPDKELGLECSRTDSIMLDRPYKTATENGTLMFMVWFAASIGGIELFLIFITWCCLYPTRRVSDPATLGYIEVQFGFKKFTYNEMKRATKNFSEEIGRGGGGIVYKGLLPDNRIAAIKLLNEASHEDGDFLAEISTIGKLNHMNLIETWGYCVEGKHRLLVYEYMEGGSLKENLTSNTLDSEKRFDIAVGTAKGLTYLHEECLEWVLHCDVKPENVLLDANFQPKVADFGLSKLFNRTGGNDSNFSTIRGTRGYMAPEWIFNHVITSKVDVYSYGVVVLEMVTGKSPMGNSGVPDTEDMEQRGLVNWVKEKMIRVDGCRIEEIMDPMIKGEYDTAKMDILVKVALQCVEEDKDARPTMRRVMEMLSKFEE